MQEEKKLLLIFTRNPILGKVKTRLAKDIGDANALEIYNMLCMHTAHCAQYTAATKRVLYDGSIGINDIWHDAIYEKQVQQGDNLGLRMQDAFTNAFTEGFTKVVIIGTDLWELQTEDIDNAFKALDQFDVVLGPAFDGGYYLLGLQTIPNNIFANKNWGSNTVLADTLKDIDAYSCKLLAVKNDIDTVEDIKGIDVFKKYV